MTYRGKQKQDLRFRPLVDVKLKRIPKKDRQHKPLPGQMVFDWADPLESNVVEALGAWEKNGDA